MRLLTHRGLSTARRRDPEFRVALSPTCLQGTADVVGAEPGAVRAFSKAAQDCQVVLAARLVADDVEQVRLQRLPALPGELAEPVAEFFGNVADLKCNHACNTTCIGDRAWPW